MARQRRRAAFTLIETLIACTVSAALLIAIGMTLQRSGDAFRAESVASDTDAQARRALERIAAEFMDARRTSLVLAPLPPLVPSSADYTRAQGFAGGAIVEGPQRQLRFEYDPRELDDGLDNDSDGLVDEGRVVLDTDVPGDGQEVVLVENVRELLEGELANFLDDNGNGLADEAGFTLAYDPITFTLTLRITVERFLPGGGVVTRTAETAVRIRND
jgi:type II secretory pathway pseudopilin PulG